MILTQLSVISVVGKSFSPATPEYTMATSMEADTATTAQIVELADEPMRKGKMMCHALFDPMWKGRENARRERSNLYRWLAGEMEIPLEDCHFGYFDIHQLRQAYRILKRRYESNRY